MILGGLVLFIVGVVALATIGITSSIILLMVYYYVAALGLVSAIVSFNIAGTTGVMHERQGLAAALLTTSQQIGAAIGVSIAGVVITGFARSSGAETVITLQGYRAALLISELFLIPAVILSLYLLHRGLARKDLGIPGKQGT
jgi:MFS family permease